MDPAVDMEGFKRYARFVSAMSRAEQATTIQGMVEGETRGLTAGLTVEEIFNAKEAFRDQVVTQIQIDLDKLGLIIFNANVREMSDYGTNLYFSYRKQRAIETANYEAQVSVAEAKKDGDRGIAEATKEGELAKKDRERLTRQRVAELDAAAVVTENLQMEERARSCASLAEVEAESNRRANVSRIESEGAAMVREQQLQRVVEEARRERQQAAKEADAWTDAAVERRILVTQAEAARDAATIRAAGEREAAITTAQGRAEALELVARAEASQIAQRLAAEAAGKLQLLQAHAEGSRLLVEACNGDPQLVTGLVHAHLGIPQQVAQANADGVKGMAPQIISINGGEGALSSTLTGLMGVATAASPLLNVLRQQGLVK